MLIAAIIFGILSLISLCVLVRKNSKDTYDENLSWYGMGFLFSGIFSLTALLVAVNLSFSTSNLTGYIYSADTTFGYTTGHIRFSEQAGTDAQPQFCVQADSEPGKKIVELAGSGKKVKVTIPPYFYFANNPFACGTTETKIEVQ